MKTSPFRGAAVVSALFAGALVTRADLLAYQIVVNGSGLAPLATHFDPVSGSAPVMINVGAVTGDSTFEFIVNAGAAGHSSSLMGNYANGRETLKFEQYPDLSRVGLTDWTVADYSSAVPSPVGVDTVLTFRSDGTTRTELWVNGELRDTLPVPLRMTGVQGLGATLDADGTTFFEPIDGVIRSFVSYDVALNPQQIADHAAAFALPEPGAAAAALALCGAGLLPRHGRRTR